MERRPVTMIPANDRTPREICVEAAEQERLRVIGMGWIDSPPTTFHVTVLAEDDPDMQQPLLQNRIGRMIRTIAVHYLGLADAFVPCEDGFSIIFVDNAYKEQVQ